MEKIILAVNAGSSSVRVSVYRAGPRQSPVQIAEAKVGGLTAPPLTLKYSRRGKVAIDNREVGETINGQQDAFSLLLQTLIEDGDFPEIRRKEDIGIVCHRVVHGGDYSKPQLVSGGTFDHLTDLNDLAPLHNASSLGIVRLCIKDLSTARNVACFDSQFHSTLREHVRTYPINQDIARKNRLRKYGFHGLSYGFVTRATAEFLGKETGEVNLIAMHLGSGASVCAIRAGKSWDTSMGLTPLAGLPGATRSGSVDPSLVFHYASDVGRLSPASTKELHISRAEEILNKEAGWKALTGTTDFAAIAAAYDDDDDDDDDDPDSRAKRRLAFDLVVDRISAFVGSYYVALRGQVDALVFAGGIGEKSARLRAAVAEQVACLGFAPLDDAANYGGGDDDDKAAAAAGAVVWDVSERGAAGRPRVLVCQTDEQYEMARMCTEYEEFW